MLADLPATVHSCSQHSAVTGTLTLEQPGSVLPLYNTFTLLGMNL